MRRRSAIAFSIAARDHGVPPLVSAGELGVVLIAVVDIVPQPDDAPQGASLTGHGGILPDGEFFLHVRNLVLKQLDIGLQGGDQLVAVTGGLGALEQRTGLREIIPQLVHRICRISKGSELSAHHGLR